MKNFVVFLIIPDFKNVDSITEWEENVNWAYSNYDNSLFNENNIIDTKKRWAIGFVAWKKLIEIFSVLKNIKIYFMRTDFRLQHSTCEIKDDIISVGFDYSYGNIIYKTLISMKHFKNDFDYIVRGNLNTIIDIYSLNKVVQLLPNEKIFSSPFWEGVNYPYGYFYILSKDIVHYITTLDIVFHSNNRWYNEDTADDNELTRVITQKYKYYVMKGGDKPNNKVSRVNKYGIRFIDGGLSEKMMYNIKMSNSDVFLYRLKNISDNEYFLTYKYLVKHIWNKIIKDKNLKDTLKIDYKTNKTLLCEIGKKYDSDKSSQRSNVTDHRHCHPYTLFYDGIFKNRKNEKLDIAELGILDGASLRMWQEYFPISNIYGFEYNTDLINNFKKYYNNERIILSQIDVTNKDSIQTAFKNINVMYDIIIEDTTHQFNDQIKVIENVYPYLKPGGLLIVEDIFKHYNENEYIKRLGHILQNFQDFYFVELDHVNKKSTGWNNDKLFILVKNGGEPIFKNKNKLTIITPSYRTNNLLSIKNSINFDYVDEWIIVYDGNKIIENPNLFKDENNDKIKEYVCKDEGISGNPQRNYALTKISNPDTFLYYLDDDNLIHPQIYTLINVLDNDKMYSFNQKDRIKGNNINIGAIDTAMVIIDYKLCKGVNWIHDKYDADGYYIKECYEKNKGNHIFVDNTLCHYNKLSI